MYKILDNDGLEKRLAFIGVLNHPYHIRAFGEGSTCYCEDM